jgi:hypothetical protein
LHAAVAAAVAGAAPQPAAGNLIAGLTYDDMRAMSRQTQRNRERRLEMRDTDSTKRIMEAVGRWLQKDRGGGISHSELWNVYMEA